MKDLAILAKYSAVHSFCPKCENVCLQKQGTTILKSLVSVKQKQKAEIDISEQTTDLLTSNKFDIQSIKQKQTEITQIPSGLTFAEKKNKTSFEASTLYNSNRAGTP